MIYTIYISGPCVSITHECYFTCDIGDASATCSWASSPLGMIMALAKHRFHPFLLSFSATWLSPSSREWWQSPTQICAEWNWSAERNVQLLRCSCRAMPEKTQLISQAARTCENTKVDFTWFRECGQTLPWGGARPVSIRHFFLWNQVFYCTTEIDIAWHGPWLHFLLHFRSRWFVWSTFWRFLWSPVSAAGLRATRSNGVARNAAKTLGSLKSLTLKLKALVLHNLDWAESASIIKVMCNHWDYLYLFVGIVLFSSIVMLWDLQGGYGWLQDEHIDCTNFPQGTVRRVLSDFKSPFWILKRHEKRSPEKFLIRVVFVLWTFKWKNLVSRRFISRSLLQIAVEIFNCQGMERIQWISFILRSFSWMPAQMSATLLQNYIDRKACAVRPSLSIYPMAVSWLAARC